ncbi:AarF/UbiB family protein [Alphaproteobacteria bacterium]|nr:AarF/UbiB family protein [Alphaproteobacteria bacterium]
MKNIKIIVPKFYEYPLIVSRFIFVLYILVRNGLVTEINRFNIINKKYQKTLNFFKFVFEKKKNDSEFLDNLGEIGPGFVKLGQALSTRPDIFGLNITNRLISLQDKLPPFSDRIAIKIIEEETNKKIDELFIFFEKKPIAAASVAQVHKGILKNGKEVAIKVLRPNIEQTLFKDFKLFYGICNILEFFSTNCKRLSLKEIIATFAHSSLDEIDLRLEASNSEQLRENFVDYELFDTPEIHWKYTTKKILISEFIDGIRIDQIKNLKQNINLKRLTMVASEIFFYQTFRDGFFHGDLHPGNIFINRSGKIIAIDFGIMGYLNLNDRKFLAKLFNFLLNKQFYKIAKLHQENGMLDKDTDLQKLSQEIRILTTPILNKPIGDVSMGHLFGEILALSRKFNIKIQAKFCLLQKSMIMAEGIARQINPKANIWQTTEPLMEEWISKNMRYDFFFEKINDKRFFSKELVEIFQKIDRLLNKFFNF